MTSTQRWAWLMVALCTAPPAVSAEGTEARLRERATAYWEARQSLDLRKAYEFYESSFREKYTADTFTRDFRRLNRFAPELVGIESVQVDPSGTKATVRVILQTEPDVLEGRELRTTHEETWVLEDDEWWKESEPLLPNI